VRNGKDRGEEGSIERRRRRGMDGGGGGALDMKMIFGEMEWDEVVKRDEGKHKVGLGKIVE